MRHAARTDGNHTEITRALRQIGVTVEYLKLPLDLLCWYRGRTFLIEIKTGEGRLTKDQVEFIRDWPGEIHIVRNAEEAVAAAIGKEAMK